MSSRFGNHDTAATCEGGSACPGNTNQLEDHPGHNAIVIKHSRLAGDGEIFASNGGYGDNSPLKMFDEVLSQHANVRFVFSGHTGVSAYREDTGLNGNTIYQFLYNRLDGANPLRVVEVDIEANTVDTYVYAPATDETMETPGCSVNLTDVGWVRCARSRPLTRAPRVRTADDALLTSC